MGTDSGVCMTYFEGDLMTTLIFNRSSLSKAPGISRPPPTKHCLDTSEFEPLKLGDISVTGMQLVFLRMFLVYNWRIQGQSSNPPECVGKSNMMTKLKLAQGAQDRAISCE